MPKLHSAPLNTIFSIFWCILRTTWLQITSLWDVICSMFFVFVRFTWEITFSQSKFISCQNWRPMFYLRTSHLSNLVSDLWLLLNYLKHIFISFYTFISKRLISIVCVSVLVFYQSSFDMNPLYNISKPFLCVDV